MSGRFHGRPPASANVRERPRTSANIRGRPQGNSPEFPPATVPLRHRPATDQLPPTCRPGPAQFLPQFSSAAAHLSQVTAQFLPVTAKQTPNSSLLALVTTELHPFATQFLQSVRQLRSTWSWQPPGYRQVAAKLPQPNSPEPAPEPVSPSATLAAEPQNSDNPDTDRHTNDTALRIVPSGAWDR